MFELWVVTWVMIFFSVKPTTEDEALFLQYYSWGSVLGCN